jgi:hypothetical protein
MTAHSNVHDSNIADAVSSSDIVIRNFHKISAPIPGGRHGTISGCSYACSERGPHGDPHFGVQNQPSQWGKSCYITVL